MPPPPEPNFIPKPDPVEEARQRKRMRIFMSFWAIGGGLLFVIFGRDWLVNGIPMQWLGYFLILLGVLALAGVNVFIGGPLDRRRDKRDSDQK